MEVDHQSYTKPWEFLRHDRDANLGPQLLRRRVLGVVFVQLEDRHAGLVLLGRDLVECRAVSLHQLVIWASVNRAMWRDIIKQRQACERGDRGARDRTTGGRY